MPSSLQLFFKLIFLTLPVQVLQVGCLGERRLLQGGFSDCCRPWRSPPPCQLCCLLWLWKPWSHRGRLGQDNEGEASTTWSSYDGFDQVNVAGSSFMVQAAVDQMQSHSLKENCSVVNLSSISAHQTQPNRQQVCRERMNILAFLPGGPMLLPRVLSTFWPRTWPWTWQSTGSGWTLSPLVGSGPLKWQRYILSLTVDGEYKDLKQNLVFKK